MRILDGKKLSEELTGELKTKIINENIKASFTTILVGENPSSIIYINKKKEKCEKLGIKFNLVNLSDNITTSELVEEIYRVNRNDNINGLIIQLPLPKHINTQHILDEVSPLKDVDCFSSVNLGTMVTGNSVFKPATPYGIELLLKHNNINTIGKNVVIIGKSLIVGTSLGIILSNEQTNGATITLCDKYTENLKNHVSKADILIVASGKHHLINDNFKIKQGVVIIDVGIHRIEDNSKKSGYKIEGDVDFKSVKDKCSYITPVPGGVGPMTVYCLLENIYTAYKLQNK